MVKRVKETTSKINLDFTIFLHLSKGSWPSKIAKDLCLSKQVINYHVASLKERNLIEMKAQGVWDILKNYEPKEYKKTSRVAQHPTNKDFYSLDEDTIRGHAFQFKLETPKNLKNWNNEKREEKLNKLKIKWEPATHLFGGGQKLVFKGKKVHLTNKSIIVYDKASYYAETSKKSQEMALIKVLYLFKALERKLRASFSIKGQYKIKPTRQHYALIKNALAKIYNKPKRTKLEVHDKKGLWLLIDNSFNLEELEAVSSATAVPDAQGMKGLMNSHKQTDFQITPDFVLQGFQQQNQAIMQNTQNLGDYAKHLQSHVKSIQQLGKKVQNDYEVMKQIKKLLEEFVGKKND